MSLSPDWEAELRKHGFDAHHWGNLGDARAQDRLIMEWARKNDAIVFTHDLDFGTILALTHANGPSVIQLRTQDIMPAKQVELLSAVISSNASALKSGALVSVDEITSRIRVLPI